MEIVNRIKNYGKLQFWMVVGWFLDKEMNRLERANERAEWDSHFEQTGLRNHRDTEKW